MEQVFNVNCGFFDSVNGDRLYSANHMNRPYKRLVTNGVFANPQGTPSTDLQVVTANDGLKIIVRHGEGIFSYKWFENPSDLVINITPNASILPRLDSVIVQVDNRTNGRTGSIVLREGTPATEPTPPAINTVTNVVEYRVANILVQPNASEIGQEKITDLRGSSECLWVTGLIEQVDTSTLYEQWNAAYRNYYETEAESFRAFMETLTSELTVATSVISYESHFQVTSDVTEVPININNYNQDKDVLIVWINGWRATTDIDYTINEEGTHIILNKTLTPDNVVNFLVLQSVILGDTESVMVEVQKLNTAVSQLKADSDWVNLTLENGATAYNTNVIPAVRKCNNQVYIRGAISNVPASLVTIATLPSDKRPNATHFINANAIDVANGLTIAHCVLSIDPNGEIKLLGSSDAIASNVMLSLATNFITE